MQDKYDIEIERLTLNPELIFNSWDHSGLLFRDVGVRFSGCLTQIRNELRSYTQTGAPDFLISAIKNDERIPRRGEDIRVSDLPVFAEWQRRLDKELNRAT